jgi:hypothetical protein
MRLSHSRADRYLDKLFGNRGQMNELVVVALFGVALASLVLVVLLITRKTRAIPHQPLTQLTNLSPVETGLDLSAVQEIEISDHLGSTLALKRLSSHSIEKGKKYSEIVPASSSVIAGAAQVLPSISLNQLAKSGNLFTATGPVKDLIKYADGTVSSIVSNGKRVTSHAGFKAADLSKLNAAAAIGASMQVMALVSGQHFMVQITKRLDVIEAGMNNLVDFHHDEKLGVLRSIENQLKAIAIKKHVDHTDIQVLRNSLAQADSISMEYLIRLDRQIADDDFTDIKERKLLSKIRASKDLEALLQEMEVEGLPFSIQISMYADALKLELKKAEYATRLKLGEIDKASEVFDELEILKKHSFQEKAPELLNQAFSKINEKAKSLVDGQWIESTKAAERLKLISSREDDLNTFVDRFTSQDNFAEISESNSEEVEILYLTNSESSETRVFIAAKEA